MNTELVWEEDQVWHGGETDTQASRLGAGTWVVLSAGQTGVGGQHHQRNYHRMGPEYPPPASYR